MTSEHNVTLGKFIIDNLTTGMYNNPFCIFREYIQNAADAIDKDAYDRKITNRKEYEIRININPESKSITVEDNGCGISAKSAEKTMLSLGDSAKISDRERGFRGIGRLGGVAYCNTLVFTTKAKGESAETRVEWDCQKIQTMLNRHDSRFQHIEAKNLIAQCVKVETQESSKKTDKSFFRVEMFGVKSVKGELLDGLKVRSYIENVAPLPFDTTKLHCAKKVDEWLVKEIPNYQTYQIFLNDSLLKKTYSQSLPIHGKQSADTLTDYEEIEIQDRQGKIIARGWRGIRQENIGAILSSSGFAGLRVRVGNILIGDEKLLDSCFGGNSNDRFNGYQVGEIHVTTSELIPNGRRDDFQDSEIKNDFLNGVSKIAVDLVKEIRNTSNSKNTLKKIDEAQQTCLKVNKQQNKGFVGDAAIKDSIYELNEKKQELIALKNKRNVSEPIKEKAEVASEKIDALLKEVKAETPNIDASLEGTVFSKQQKELIRKVLEAVYDLYDSSQDKNGLLDSVLKKLKRNNKS